MQPSGFASPEDAAMESFPRREARSGVIARTAQMGRTVGCALFFVVSLMTARLQAEVMDKEPSVADNWLVAIVTGIVAFAAWRWRWWTGAMVSVIFGVIVFNVLAELHDPYVGAGILKEAGASYVWHFGASVVLGAALHVGAAYFGLRQRGVRSASARRRSGRWLP